MISERKLGTKSDPSLSELRDDHAYRSRRPSYRWVVLAVGFLAVFGALGFGRFGYSAILPAMQKNLGITSAAAGSLASWNLAGYTIMAALGGLMASRFGPRLVAGTGCLVAAVGMLLTGFANGVSTAAAARFLTGLGGGAVLVPSVGLMSTWFGSQRRGMASSIVSSGSSLALVITGPVVPAIIGNGQGDSWRVAWYFFAGLTFVVGVLALAAQRNRPYKAAHAFGRQGSIWKATPQRPSSETGTDMSVAAALTAWSSVSARTKRATLGLRRVIRSHYAWHMGLVYMAFGFAYMVYFTFFQKRLTTDLHMSSTKAGSYFLVLGIASLACGFLWGTISDRVGREKAIAMSCLLQATATALFALWPSTAGIVLSAVLFGLTAVALPGMVGAGCGDKFGAVLAPASLGFLSLFLGVGQVLGPYLAGKMADHFLSLKYSYLLAAGVFLVGAALAAVLGVLNRTSAGQDPSCVAADAGESG